MLLLPDLAFLTPHSEGQRPQALLGDGRAAASAKPVDALIESAERLVDPTKGGEPALDERNLEVVRHVLGPRLLPVLHRLGFLGKRCAQGANAADHLFLQRLQQPAENLTACFGKVTRERGLPAFRRLIPGQRERHDSPPRTSGRSKSDAVHRPSFDMTHQPSRR